MDGFKSIDRGGMIMRYLFLTIGAAAMLPLAGCGSGASETKPAASGPQGVFMASFQDKCGRAFRGKMVAGDNEELADKELVLAIAPCEAGGDVTMALHANIGPLQVSSDKEIWDRSRTLTLSQGGDVLILILGDHQEDGSAGPMQDVKADSMGTGSETRQSFALAGAEQPLVIDEDAGTITLQIPATEAAKGFGAEFSSSDRIAMPPPAWGQTGG